MTDRATSHLWPGVPLALGSAALFGAIAPLSKMLLTKVDPLMLAGLLYLGAGVGLSAYRAVRTAEHKEAPLKRTDLPWLAMAIAFGGVTGPILLMLGLSWTTASNAALLLNLEGLATMAIAWLVFRENVDRRLLIGAFAILAGAVLLSWQGTGVSLDPGALLIAGACLAWGIDNNVTRKISATDPVVLASAKCTVAGIVNAALAFVTGAALPPMSTAVIAALAGLFGIGVSLVMFIVALRHLGTARTGAYYSLAPFIGAAMAIILLGDAVTLQLVAAGILMAVGLAIHLTETHLHTHTHEALEHEHSHVHDAHHQHEHDGGPVTEPHSHWHRHEPMVHRHVHYPDLHHQHRH